MKTIGYYVSDTGFGHITRSLALIEQIMEESDYQIYLVSGRMQIEYAKIYLIPYEGRIIYQITETEAKTVYFENTLTTDVKTTEKNVEKFIHKLPDLLAKELEVLKELPLECVITDFSILGIEVAKALGIKKIGLSNYTWYHRYQKKGIKQEYIERYLKLYNELDLFYRLAMADKMDGLTCPTAEGGHLMRRVNFLASVDLKKMYWPTMYLSIGQIAHKKDMIINFQSGHVFAAGSLTAGGDAHVINLPNKISHSQDYLMASSLALIKPGWATVMECLILGKPFGIIVSEDSEDEEMIEKLKEMNCCFTLHEDALNYLDVKKLNIKAINTKRVKVPDDTVATAKKLLKFVKGK